MRICLDVRFTTQSGASTFIRGFVNQLRELDHTHEIDFVAHRDRDLDLQPDVHVPYRNRWLEFQWSQTTLPRHLRNRQYDIYHSLKHVGPVLCPVRSVYRVPAVGQFEGRYPQSVTNQFYWGQVARRAYCKADMLIAVSDYIREGLLERLGIDEDRVVTVHNGVDPRFRRVEYNTPASARLLAMGIDRPYILSVANVEPVKNHATIIRALQLRRRQHGADLQFVCAGNHDTDHGRELMKLTRVLKLDSQVRFVGRRSFEDLLLLYNRAECVVHPSLHEGLSSTLLEAMACGVPVVAARTTSIPETLGDAGLYHEAMDVEELANCVAKVLSDSKLSNALGQAGIHRAAQFTWHRCLERTLAAYSLLA